MNTVNSLYFKKKLYLVLKKTDFLISKFFLKLFKEKKSLLIFLFHSIFENEKDISSNIIDPQQKIILEKFDKLINYYLEQKFVFINPHEILNNQLVFEKRYNDCRGYILLTFDDGYFNNYIAINLLQQYNIPCVLFVTIANVLENKSFWWDVVYRNRKRVGVSKEKILAEYQMLRSLNPLVREDYLRKEFGSQSLRPISDLDRPFSTIEIKELSENPLIYFGNHTVNHVYLPGCPVDDVYLEFNIAQKELLNMTGREPIIISYPYGAWSPIVIKMAKNVGLKLGITGIESKNFFPLNFNGDSPMLLNRFVFDGTLDIVKQCYLYRSDIHLLGGVKKLRGKLLGICQ